MKRKWIILITVLLAFAILFVWLNYYQNPDNKNHNTFKIEDVDLVNYNLNCKLNKEIERDSQSSVCLNLKFKIDYPNLSYHWKVSSIQPGLDGSIDQITEFNFFVLRKQESIKINSFINTGSKCNFATCYSKGSSFESINSFLELFNNGEITAPDLEHGINFNIPKEYLLPNDVISLVIEFSDGRKISSNIKFL